MSIRLIVFDLDGTLLDTREKYFACMRSALRQNGSMPDFDRVIGETFGMPGREIMRRLGLSDAQIESASEEIRRFLSELPLRAEQYAGTLETMRHFRKTRGVAIATARNEAELRADIDARPFLDECGFVCATTDDMRPKPAPDVLNKAIQTARVLPEEAVYIGDTVADWQCAKEAGTRFAAAGWNPLALRTFAVLDTAEICVCESTDDLIKFVESDDA